MSRVMTIWLPRWPVQQRLLARPELRRVPVFVCRRERRGVMKIVSWAWARPPRRAGGERGPVIPAGASLAEGMAVLASGHGSRACHVAEVCADDPAGDAAELARVARWCRRFAPIVGIEAAAAPECIHLDVTGTADFFGGEAALARTAAWTLAARGLHARVAIADTCGASWAAARHTDLVPPPAAAGGRPGPAHHRPAAPRRWAVVPAGAAAAALAGLPAAALRLDAATLAALGEVGIDSIGGVLRLSAKSLAARFPAVLVRRRAEFVGTLAEPLVTPAELELPRAAHEFDVPLPLAASVADTIRDLLERLVGRCTAALAARGEGVLALQVRLEPAVTAIDVATGRCADVAPTVVDVGVFRPSGSPRHLVELVMLRLGRCRLPRELAAIAVEVVAAGRGTCRQKSLFASADTGAAEADTETGMLLDRLAGRLGRAAVFEPRAVADPQPEHAWIASPPSPVATAPSSDRAARRSAVVADVGLPAAGRRPIWLPPRPVPLESSAAVVPDGPPVQFRLGDRWHRVARSHGPERIETAWWRGATVRRDYYVVETEAGERFWVFRRLRDGGWFLHGVFA
jgi:protein ImuB